eukprot:GHVS01083851.1.p1 GENE.GHVS01083851.1~~GHVS01083851.1.p1  ORF type:complete len:845 (-),score=142.32 GHVS01083851.1:444-2978(-)
MADKQMRQMIDYDGTFVGDVSEWMDSAGLTDVGFAYSVVTVLGSQSSGKSTLLNSMFGTCFQVMDSQLGHSQTTKGLWIGRDQLQDGRTIIIDVEGNDSKERGDDRLTFEHRAALFSLALADCVVVNMWYMSLGNYTASSYGLLKTVMEVNLGLFLQEKDCPKTLLLFVVRDWTDAMTPLARMEAKIYKEYILHIWSSITKPEALTHSRPEDFFDFEVVGLPHAFMLPDQFTAAVAELKDKWHTKLRPNSYSRHIPSDGFGAYCGSIWDTIQQQSELDIPSQKEMLATFRCQEIKNNVLLEVRPLLQQQLDLARRQELADFQQWANSTVLQSLDLYSEPASRYQEPICEKIQVELLDNIFTDVQKVVDAHLSHKLQRLAQSFTSELEILFGTASGGVWGHGTTVEVSPLWKDFNHMSGKLQSDYMESFAKAAADCRVCVKLPTGVELVRKFDSKADGLSSLMDKDVSQVRERLLERFKSAMKMYCSDGMEALQDMLPQRNYTHAAFRQAVTKTAVAAKQRAKAALEAAWAGLQPKGKDAGLDYADFDMFCGLCVIKELRRCMEAIASSLHQHILARFESFFQYDEDDQPRQWPQLSSDSLKQIFLSSKDKALIITEVTRSLNVDATMLVVAEVADADTNLNIPVLADTKLASLVHRAVKSMQNSCRDAQFIQATGGRTSWRNVPGWIWIVLLAVGWNELWSSLSFLLMNPLTLGLLFPMALVVIVVIATGQFRWFSAMILNGWMMVKAVALPVALHGLSNVLQQVQAVAATVAAAAAPPAAGGDHVGRAAAEKEPVNGGRNDGREEQDNSARSASVAASAPPAGLNDAATTHGSLLPARKGSRA